MKLLKIAVSGVAMALGVSAGFAQAQEERNYDASIALGFVGTSGNTETSTFNLEALLAYRTDSWVHNMKFQALSSSKSGTTNAERYYLEDKSDYALDDDAYFFGKGTYTADRFSGYDSQASVSAGYGRYFYRQENLTIQGYGGIGYRKSDFTNGGDISEGIVTIGESLEWDLSETAKVVQSFTSEIGEEITVSKFEIGMETNIVDNIVTKVSVTIKNISEVPVGVEKTDTLTSVSLVYTF